MVHGETSWKVVESNKPDQKSESDFLSLADGPNTVRFVTPAFGYVVHEYKHPNAKYATKIRCSIDSEDKKCPLCESKNEKERKKKQRFYAGVLDRKSNKVKILDFGNSIQNGIAIVDSNKKWGPVIGYDFVITKNSKASTPADWYKTTPEPKEPLTSSEQELIDNFNIETLKRLSAPQSYEKVKAKIQAVNDKNGGDPSQFEKASDDSQVKSFDKSTGTVMASSSDDDDDFKDYDSN